MSLATATFNEILDDLSCRFIINIPAEESLTVERLGFQIEEAHWFYEDFIRELNPSLPNFTLKNFSNKLFTHCPLLKKWSSGHDQHYGNFLDYKLTVPVCGAIVLNRELNECVCVKGYSNRSTWGFPRGKIDSNEEDYVCAIRELKEEIGFDLTPYIQPEQYIQIYVRKQRIKLFIIPCIPKHLEFKPKTRKEISRIQWFPLSYFPNFTTKNVPQDAPIQSELKLEGHGRFYLINPFMK
ncbi:DCP2-domain-containing protein [Neoconidiobolus thromboides FSU 785]|nr:DCP2-domain-containing protein [Neoconidiobolus thromboides FSU 785]